MGIDRRGSGSCSLQTNNMRIVPAKPDWSGFGGSPRATITRRVASILHWVSSSTCWHRMNGRLLHSTISPAASRRARAEDVVVVERQRYCNPASTSAVPETASSAA
jgi:hypothetical protein